ncbi:50S ribosomal protein L6 [Candidatus Giovannonibacteria bacterium]|nr:50S ribosomal protein L6 [Candidatus Giovannonibacteria bacterium]
MSRLGKKPIVVPPGVEVKIQDGSVFVKGPKGELSKEFRREISMELRDNLFQLSLRSQSKLARKLWGTYVSLVKNMLIGASEGYAKKLILEGIGYRAQAEGKDLVLNLGFSHPVKFPAPDGISFKVEKNLITISGIDKEKVGQTAAKLRSLKKPDPYKGKGFRYEGEIIKRKAGKKATSSA